MDDALRGAEWAISANPEIFEVVSGMEDVRLLKIALGDGLPGLRIWFKIDDDGQRVHLLYSEPIPSPAA